MPLYDFRCAEEHVFERYVKLEDFSGPQHCACGSLAQRELCAPRVMGSDTIEPCVGMDGKTHDSLSSLRATYKPSGNPRGESYIEIGSEKRPEHKPKQFDRKQRRDDLHAAIADVKYGRVAPTQTGI